MKTSLKLIKKKSTGYEFETSRCHLDMIYAHQLTDVDVEVARLSYSFKKKMSLTKMWELHLAVTSFLQLLFHVEALQADFGVEVT